MQDYQPISYGEQRRSERPLTQSERIAYRNRMKKKKQNQRRMQIGGASVLLIVIIVAIILIVKGCSGATDALAGTWDLDSNTTYEFDGKGSGAMLLTLADYDFTYEIWAISLNVNTAATDVSALLQIWMLFLFALMKKMVKIQNLYCIRKDKNK